MFIPPTFLDTLRAHISMASIVRQNVKLIRSGRDWKGCCPFHHEKTPSFYVYTDHYHCFGCGKHGDIIRYVMDIYNLSFIDAVQSLARQAGLSLPRDETTPEERHKRQSFQQEKQKLYALLDEARIWFCQNLYHPQNRQAINYLYKRGLTDSTIRQFSLGWAPRGSGQLRNYLIEKGFTDQQMHRAGILREGSDGKNPREWFYGRIIFPISDAKGRVVSFGGRALGDEQPKYLNGRETELFLKRSILFNYHHAWDAIKTARAQRKKCEMIVVEGYLDVIIMAQNGFPYTVAPLGTALTEQQLEQIWRISSEPNICFDGDNAGRRAMIRAAELALSHLDFDRSIYFCLLPEGEDPDSLLTKKGPQGIKNALNQALPLSDMIFDVLSAEINPSVPQERAKLRKRLQELARHIPDKILASEYRKAFLDRFFSTYHFKGKKQQLRPQRTTKAVIQERSTDVGQSIALERQKQMFQILYFYPPLVDEVEDALIRQNFAQEFLPFRDLLLDLCAAGNLPENAQEFSGLLTHMDKQDVLTPLSLTSEVRATYGDLCEEELKKRWWDFYEMMNRDTVKEGLQKEIMNFLDEGEHDEEGWKKLKERIVSFSRLQRGSI